jgi:hypothetical protein
LKACWKYFNKKYLKTEKQNERAKRETFDVKELQLRCKGYKQKDDNLNMIMRNMNI